jgi:hypothetical protein
VVDDCRSWRSTRHLCSWRWCSKWSRKSKRRGREGAAVGGGGGGGGFLLGGSIENVRLKVLVQCVVRGC